MKKIEIEVYPLQIYMQIHICRYRYTDTIDTEADTGIDVDINIDVEILSVIVFCQADEFKLTTFLDFCE